MGVEKILLELDIKGKDSGASREVNRIIGTLDDLSSKLTNLAMVNPFVSVKKQLAAVRREIETTVKAAQASGENVSKIYAKVDPKTGKSKVSYSKRQTGEYYSMLVLEHKKIEQEYKRHQRELERIQREQQRSELRMQRIHGSALREDVMRGRNQQRRSFLYDWRSASWEDKDRTRKQRESTLLVAREERQEQIRIRNQQRRAEMERRMREQQRRSYIATAFGTAGFAMMNITGQMSNMFDSFRFGGLFKGVFSKILGNIGGLLGSTMSSIFSDLGNALGSVVEGTLNSIGILLSTGIKSLGSLLGGMAIAVIRLPFALGANLIIGLISGLVGSLFQLFTGMVSMITEVFKSLFTALGSIINAGLTILKSLFEGVVKMIVNMWKGFWETLTTIAETSLSAINGIFNQLIQGFQNLIKEERLAIKAFVQVSDTTENMGRSLAQGRDVIFKISDDIRKKWGTDMQDTMSGIYYILSSGIRDIGSAAKITGDAAILATAANEPLKGSAESITSVMMAYGKTAKESKSIAEDMWGATATGRWELGQYLSALQNVIGAASSANVSFRDLNSVMVAGVKAGINVTRMSVGLNRILGSLINPTKANDKAMEELGIDWVKLRKEGKSLWQIMEILVSKAKDSNLRELFGAQQGIRGFQAFRNGLKDSVGLLKEMDNAAKNLDNAANMSTNTWEVLFNKITAVKDIIFRTFATVFTDPFRPLIASFDNWIQNLDFKPLEEWFSNIGKELSIALQGAINGFTAIFGLVNWNDLLKGFGDTILDFIKKIREVLTNPATYDYLVKSFKIVGAIVEYIRDIFVDMFNNPMVFVNNLSILFDMLKEGFLVVTDFLYERLKEIFSTISDFFVTSIGSKIKGVFNELFTAISSGLNNKLNNIVTGSKREDTIEMKALKLTSPTSYNFLKSMQDLVPSMQRTMYESMLSVSDFFKESTTPQYSRESLQKSQVDSLFNLVKKISEDRSKMATLETIPETFGVERKTPIGISERDIKILTTLFIDSIRKNTTVEGAKQTFVKEVQGKDKELQKYFNIKEIELQFSRIADMLMQQISSVQSKRIHIPDLRLTIAEFVESLKSSKSKAEQYEKFESFKTKFQDISNNFGTNLKSMREDLSNVFSNFAKDWTSNNPKATENLQKNLTDILNQTLVIQQENNNETRKNTEATKENTNIRKEKPKEMTGFGMTKLLPTGPMDFAKAFRDIVYRNPGANVREGGMITTSHGTYRSVEIIPLEKPAMEGVKESINSIEEKKTDNVTPIVNATDKISQNLITTNNLLGMILEGVRGNKTTTTPTLAAVGSSGNVEQAYLWES